MQLKNMTGLRPLTITSLLLVNSLSSFAYSDIDQYNNFNFDLGNGTTVNYINKIETESYTEILLKRTFNEHLLNWQRKTQYFSSVQQIIGNNDFQSIVKIGERAVPLIVDELKQKPSLLVWALNLIYKKKITNNPDTTIEEASRLWVKKLKL